MRVDATAVEFSATRSPQESGKPGDSTGSDDDTLNLSVLESPSHAIVPSRSHEVGIRVGLGIDF
jgi:hypothetical protein